MHSKVPNEHLTQHLAGILRLVQPKVKKALSYREEEEFFMNFAKWFQSFTRMTSEFVNKFGNWYGNIYKLFHQEAECSLSDAERFYQMGKGKFSFVFLFSFLCLFLFCNIVSFSFFFTKEFPIKPPLLDDLHALIEKANQFENKLQNILNSEKIDENLLESFNEEVTNDIDYFLSFSNYSLLSFFLFSFSFIEKLCIFESSVR